MAQPSKHPHPSDLSYPPDGILARMAEQSQIDFEVAFFGDILKRHPAYIDLLRVHAHNLSLKGLHAESLEIDRRWAQLQPDDPLAHYNLACSYALTGQPDLSLIALRRAIEIGYRDFRHIREDRDLDLIRNDPRFRQLLREYENQ